MISIGRKAGASDDLLALLLECHARIRTFIELACTVGERSDLAPADVIEACDRVARYFAEALPLHVVDEEESLRPRLAGQGSQTDGDLETMHQDHEAHRPDLGRLDVALSRVWASPADTQAKAELADVAKKLRAAFFEHLDLEERSIFPAIERTLDQATREAIVSEIRARRRPA